MTLHYTDPEKVFSYGSAISVIQLSETDISSYLTRGLISTNYQGRPARYTSYDCVCFTVLPDAGDASQRVSKVLRMNCYLQNMLNPEEWFKQYQEAGVVLSAVIADFNLIALCPNVYYVKANGRLSIDHFPYRVLGIDPASFDSCRRGHSNMFDAEVRVYLDERRGALDKGRVARLDPTLTGVTQNAWKGLMVMNSNLSQISQWFKGVDRATVRELPIFDENQRYVCSTHDLFL